MCKDEHYYQTLKNDELHTLFAPTSVKNVHFVYNSELNKRIIGRLGDSLTGTVLPILPQLIFIDSSITVAPAKQLFASPLRNKRQYIQSNWDLRLFVNCVGVSKPQENEEGAAKS